MSPIKLICNRKLMLQVRNAVKSVIRYTQKPRHFCSNRQFQHNRSSTCESGFIQFENFIETRRDEAKRSVLIQVKTENSCKNLLDHCKNYGDLKSMHFYTLDFEMNFVLVEFRTVEAVDLLIRDSAHMDLNRIIPVRSRLLWFRTDDKTDAKVDVNNLDLSILTKQDVFLPSETEIENNLKSASSFSDQMTQLYEKTKLNDLGIRLRFTAAQQVELALSGMFSSAKVYPFGSSVNGFGKIGCDLDLALQLDLDAQKEIKRLIFHVKPATGVNRMATQRHMELIGDLLQFFLPGCSFVRRILHARVPILKYKQDLMGLECDLSMTNMAAFYMSEMLYLFGCYDKRIYPLIFTVRYWAKEIGLTNPSPGRWISNFSLTLLVIFYLQQKNIIPSLGMLVKHQRPEDKRIVDDNTDCSFLRNVNNLPKPNDVNSDDLFSLFCGLCEFYSTFDFHSLALSLNTGTTISKPEHSSLYIVNPLERHLNVSKNVSAEECKRLRIEFHNAACILGRCGQDPGTPGTSWGLLSLVKNRLTQNMNDNKSQKSAKGSQRLMSIRELFNDGVISFDSVHRDRKNNF